LIETYLKLLLDTVAASPIVHASNVVLDKRTPRAGLIRGDLYFADGSRLHFRELVEIQANVVRQMYSYHYQRADDSLIFRYDDTPHHSGLPNFPHHKHVGSETNVISVAPPDLPSVLREIEAMYPLAGDRD
jgi:hypothetical protein